MYLEPSQEILTAFGIRLEMSAKIKPKKAETLLFVKLTLFQNLRVLTQKFKEVLVLKEEMSQTSLVSPTLFLITSN